MSLISCPDYDERLVPERLQRPFEINLSNNQAGALPGRKRDRLNHDSVYPDIAVPLELVKTFVIAAGQNQSIWGDIYIPKDVPAGRYQSTRTVQAAGQTGYTLISAFRPREPHPYSDR